MKRILTALIAVAAFFCISCNTNRKSDEKYLNKNTDVDQQIQVADSIKIPEQKIEKTDPQVSSKIDWDKKIIKTANLNGEVKDYKLFSKQLSDKVKNHGGYVSSEEQTQTEYKIENTVVIKVPVDQFENMVNDLVNDVVKINEKRITSDDVTTELVDGKSRLEAKKQVRLRYLDLLKEAKNMGEILNVQNEINQIQEEIETVSGRINFLGHSSAMSTINFTFAQVLNASIPQQSANSFTTRIKSAFANGWVMDTGTLPCIDQHLAIACDCGFRYLFYPQERSDQSKIKLLSQRLDFA
jgi:hypothetical protein